jgi:hypothetical protein
MATNLFTNGNELKILETLTATNLITNGNELNNINTNGDELFVAIRLSFVAIRVVNY